MSLKPSTRNGLIASFTASLLLSACTQSELRLQPDFGVAVRQDAAAQIADPDAHYAGIPAPGSNGSRVSLAQTRYQKGDVVTPASTSTSGLNMTSAASSATSAGSLSAPTSPPSP